MITRNVDNCKNEARFMAVTIFHMSMNLILLLMMNINIYIFYFIREILEQEMDVTEQNMCHQITKAT